MKEFPTRYRYLPNGVRDLQINDPSRDVFAAAAYVDTGSINDGSHQGKSHKTEHEIFKGSEKKTEREMSLAVDNLGANHSANTEKEHTIFYMETLAEKAHKTLALLGEVISQPRFPEKSFKLENGVLVSEISSYKDDQVSTTLEQFEKVMFKGSDMATPILGTERSVRSTSRREIKKYYNQWFRGSHMLVVTGGKVRGTGKLVEKYFGNLPPDSDKENEKGTSGYGKPETKVLTRNTEQAHFVIGVPGITMEDPRYFTLQVMEAILGGHSVFDEETTLQSSRLYNATRVKRGVVYDVSATSYAGEKVGYFGVTGDVRPHLFKNVLDIVKKEIFSLSSTVTKEEVYRAKEFLRLYYHKKVEQTIDLVFLMGLPALMLDVVEQPAKMIEEIESVNLKKVRDLAEELLRPEEMRLMVLGPFDEELKRLKKSDF